MKVGDLVRSANKEKYNHGIGLVVRRLHKNPFLSVFDPEEPRWAILWTNPLYTMEDGCSVQYESELEVVSETCER